MRCRSLRCILLSCLLGQVPDASAVQDPQFRPFIGGWVQDVIDTSSQALTQMLANLPEQRQWARQRMVEGGGAPRPAALASLPLSPSKAGLGDWFGKGVSAIVKLFKNSEIAMMGALKQMDKAMATPAPESLPNPTDNMLGGMMGYAGPWPISLDMPGLEWQPNKHQGLESDLCSFHLENWLSGCEWSPAPAGSFLEVKGLALRRKGQAAALLEMSGTEGYDFESNWAALSSAESAENAAEGIEGEMPDVDKKIILPAQFLSRKDGKASQYGQGVQWVGDVKDVTARRMSVEQAIASNAEAAKPNGLMGRIQQEGIAIQSDGAEDCYKLFNKWMQKCVIAPM